MLELKTPQEIEAMRTTGAFIAELLDDLQARAAVGVNLLDLEYRARAADRGPRRGVLLLGLRAVLRSRTVPQRHLPVGQ